MRLIKTSTANAATRLTGLVILGWMLLAASCYKPKKVYRFIPLAMKAYWDFKPGSYWIYQDSATGALDTVTVTNYNNYLFEGELSWGKTPAHCEFLEVTMYHSGDQYYRNYWVNTSYGAAHTPEHNAVWWNKYGDTDYITTSKCFMYPLIIGNTTYSGNGFFTNETRVNNVFEQLWGYPAVVEITQNYNMVEGDQHTRTYWAGHVGVVKYMYVDSGVTKTLIDYHINP